jgi:hypothetical protein
MVLSVVGQSGSSFVHPSGLIQSAVEHRWTDEGRADQFTYLELWHNRNTDRLGKVLVDESAKFESVHLEGKPFLRMLERNGVPLAGDEARAEEQNFNSTIESGSGITIQDRIAALVSRSVGLGVNLDLLPQYFNSVFIGMDVINGRDTFKFDCTPRTDVKAKSKDDAKSTQFHLKVWIDAHDLEFARVDAELLTDRDHLLSGTTAALTWAPIDKVWLPQEMNIRGREKHKGGALSFQTDYIFSNYRKFRTSSRVLSIAPIPSK